MTATKSQPELIEMQVLEQAAAVLRVMAHPHRLKIVELLMARKHSVGELAEEMSLAPNAVSQHLNQMKAHRILEVDREGRTAYYRVVNPNAKNLIRCIARHGHGQDYGH
jgi:DNA-binding transcriptional ArsR family regulator